MVLAGASHPLWMLGNNDEYGGVRVDTQEPAGSIRERTDSVSPRPGGSGSRRHPTARWVWSGSPCVARRRTVIAVSPCVASAATGSRGFDVCSPAQGRHAHDAVAITREGRFVLQGDGVGVASGAPPVPAPSPPVRGGSEARRPRCHVGMADGGSGTVNP